MILNIVTIVYSLVLFRVQLLGPRGAESPVRPITTGGYVPHGVPPPCGDPLSRLHHTPAGGVINSALIPPKNKYRINYI